MSKVFFFDYSKDGSIISGIKKLCTESAARAFCGASMAPKTTLSYSIHYHVSSNEADY